MVRSTIPLLVVGMLATGIANSIFNKYQDMQCVAHCEPGDRRRQDFTQPVWQTLQMFLGESLCLLPVGARLLLEYRRSSRGRYSSVAAQDPDENQENSGNAAQGESETEFPSEELKGKAILLFLTPALCDIIGTSLMNVGLLFTPVSIYQMTRGALVLWVGVFSVIFLRRHLFLFQWLCLVMVMLGVSIVGLSGTLLQGSQEGDGQDKPSDGELPPATQALLGVFLILFAQIFTASQFVLEEKIMSKYTVEPLLAVGYEGMFGFLATLVAMILLHITIGMTPDGRGGPFDIWSGWTQIMTIPAITLSSVAIALSIALFNFFGLSVTRSVSATARSTIDTSRTLGIWIVSLLLGWEQFKPLTGTLQSIGFALLVAGTMIFNGVIMPPKFLRPKPPKLDRKKRRRHRSRSRSRVRQNGAGPPRVEEQAE